MPKKPKEGLGAIAAAPDLAAYCPDLATWPQSWCGGETLGFGKQRAAVALALKRRVDRHQPQCRRAAIQLVDPDPPPSPCAGCQTPHAGA